MCTAAGWIHEINYGGFRIIARRDAAGVCPVTRNGYNFADRFPLIVAAIPLPARGLLSVALRTSIGVRRRSSPSRTRIASRHGPAVDSGDSGRPMLHRI